MPVTSANSVRGLARALGISHTTVSDALRGSPRVRRETRERVQRAALEAGYHYNPLAGALMSEMRRSGVGAFRGVIAIVDLECDAIRANGSGRYHQEIVAGASEVAARLGFKTETFILGEKNLSIPRLGSILHSRGIRGILLLPAGSQPDLLKLDWSQFAGIYTDYLIEKPALDAVCSDHFRSMVIALQKVEELGYRRPGLVLLESHDRRLLFRWEAAFRTYHEHHQAMEATKPYVAQTLTKEGFLHWFNETRPDVVMCHRPEVLTWMREAGAEVPESHGFCCLNVLLGADGTAGLDLQPRLLGARGMEALVAQLHRNEYGIPATASTITIPAIWRSGPTLCQQRAPRGKTASRNAAKA
jgi:LacI family transcriptional regulator